MYLTERQSPLLAVATVLATMLAPLGATYAAAEERWDLSVFVPLSTPQMQVLQDFADTVLEETGGEVEITLRAAGELPYAVSDYHRAVGGGEIAMADTAFLTADLPAAGVLTLPFLVGSYDELEVAVDAVWPALVEGLDRFGAEPLMWSAYAPIELWGTGDPVTSIDQLKGMSIRAVGPESAELLTQLGATPVTMATPEVATALQYGTIEAIVVSPYGIPSIYGFDTFSWGLTISAAATPTYILVNKQMMADLPDELEATVRRVADEFQQKYFDVIVGLERDAMGQIAEAGVAINAPSDADRQKLRDIASEIWVSWAESRGEEAVKALDTVKKSLGRK